MSNIEPERIRREDSKQLPDHIQALYVTAKDGDKESLKTLDELAHRNVKAQVMLGDMFFEGDGVKQDPEKALYWYQKAAEQDESIQERLENLEFQKQLGEMFYYEDGNVDKAIYWLEKAANQEDLESQIMVADLYYFGEIPFNSRSPVHTNSNRVEKAIEWYEKAIQNDNEVTGDFRLKIIDIHFFLGAIYSEGNGVTQDKFKAAELYMKGDNLRNRFFKSF